MTIPASIVIPTRNRPDYLEVALASIAPQAAAVGAEVLVVDDAGPSGALRALAERHGARYEPHPQPQGLNVARNTGVERSRGELVAFVDDDVEVRPGWLQALLGAARMHPEADVFTGPIRPRLEGTGRWTRHSCGQEGPPITALDLGPSDTSRVRYAWGANMAVRRSALERVGPFDPRLEQAGDEQEWQDRLRAGGDGLVMYVAGAALDHRRSARDARMRVLIRAAYARGRAARRFDAWCTQTYTPPRTSAPTPTLVRELRTLLGCTGHVVRRRCPAGLAMVAHSAGRLRQALTEAHEPAASTDPPAGSDLTTASSPGATASPRGAAASPPGGEDFLSGESGTVGGLGALGRELADRLVDAGELAGGRRWQLRRAARAQPPRQRVLVIGVARPEHRKRTAAIATELARSRHDVEVQLAAPGDAGKFENLNRLLAAQDLTDRDWLLVVDDDVVLPGGFLDNALLLAERFAFDLMQPAHRARSHGAWRVTRRRPGLLAHETCFVEIGPVTAFARRTFATLLPFPALRMGWGLDLHWAALARAQGWRCGVLDAVAIRHSAAPAAAAYSREQAIAEARGFLARNPYVPAGEAQRTLATHRRL